MVLDLSCSRVWWRAFRLAVLVVAPVLAAPRPDAFGPEPKPVPAPASVEIEQAIRRGVDFLVECQAENGWWGSARVGSIGVRRFWASTRCRTALSSRLASTSSARYPGNAAGGG